MLAYQRMCFACVIGTRMNVLEYVRVQSLFLAHNCTAMQLENYNSIGQQLEIHANIGQLSR